MDDMKRVGGPRDEQIVADDVAGWDSLNAIAETLSKRGFEPRPDLERDDSPTDELLVKVADRRYIALIEAGPDEVPSDHDRHHEYQVPTHCVATDDYETFTFVGLNQSLDAHGQISRSRFSFTREQVAGGDRYTVLDKLNDLEYGDARSVDALYDTRQVVDDFYKDFEDIRADLVTEVVGIPDDSGEAKRRYVQVMLNRLIFLYFIQEKGLLDFNDDYLLEEHERREAADEDVYGTFYEPLFFEALAKEGANPDFGHIPYLNGGLFSEARVEEEYPDARLGGDSEATNAVFREILEFLDDWNWHVDERLDVVEPKNISPEVLGHIFERSVNQKEMGAYYTPEEITDYMARESIHPRVLEELNATVGADYDSIDEVFGLNRPADNATGGTGDVAADGGAVDIGTDSGTSTRQAPLGTVDRDHVAALYFDVLDDTSVLDPAVGSGAFLLAAEDVLVDIHVHAIEYFRRLAEDRPFAVTGRIDDELAAVDTAATPTLYAKRRVILSNLYGVDIDEGAVEICKLRLWLSMVADIESDPTAVDPLPNIDFNIRRGNSLVGFTDVVEINDEGDARLTNYGAGVGDGVRGKYEDIIEAVEGHRAATTKEETERWRAEAERRREEHIAALNEKVLQQYHAADLDDVTLEDVESYVPFHWVIEYPTVYRDGGFDVVIGNPPWDRIKANREDYFTEFAPEFRTLRGDAKDDRQDELLEDDEIAAGWEAHKTEMDRRATYFNNSPDYEMQESQIDGRTEASENDLSSLFLERVLDIAHDDTHVAQILPGRIFTGSPTKRLRLHLLNETSVETLIGFENHGIFDGVDTRYKFGITVFKNSGQTESLRGAFQQMDLSCVRDPEVELFEISRQILEDFSPSSALFPMLRSERELSAIRTLIDHPGVGDNEHSWYANPYRPLDKTQDSERFFNDPDEGDYPIFTGRNFYQFCYDDSFYDIDDIYQWSVDEDYNPERSAKRRIREKQVRKLKRAVYEAFDGDRTSKSMKGFVNDLLEKERGTPLRPADVVLDSSEYLLGFRRVSNATNERTLVASLVSTAGVCDYSFYITRPFEIHPDDADLRADTLHGAYERIFTDRELCVAVGLLNSVPFDYLMRRKVDNSIPMYSFEETQVPHLTAGDDWFEYIAHRAARLNCYGDAFAELRRRLGDVDPATDQSVRRELQAEIDAAAFRAYGIEDDAEVAFVLGDFHQVEDPRLMDDAYFELVLAKFRELPEAPSTEGDVGTLADGEGVSEGTAAED